MRTSRQSRWFGTKRRRRARPSAVTDLDDPIKPVLCPDPQLLDGYRASLIFSLAHVCKTTLPPKLTKVGEVWSDNI